MAKQKQKETFNRLCSKCLRSCRQPGGTLLVNCPRFLPRPFDVKSYRYDQLDLFKEDRKK